MNKTELAHAFDVTPETISAWQRRGLPVAKRGRNGEAYEFSLPDVVRWRVGQLVRGAPWQPHNEGFVFELIDSIGGGLALMVRDLLYLSPHEAWQVVEFTLRLMMDAVETQAPKLADGSLSAELLTPYLRQGMVERLSTYRSHVNESL